MSNLRQLGPGGSEHLEQITTKLVRKILWQSFSLELTALTKC